MARENDKQPAIMQREDELARLVAVGKRTDDGAKCTLVLLRRTGGDWLFYPHGVDRFGVRLTDQEARRMAQTILHRGQYSPEVAG